MTNKIEGLKYRKQIEENLHNVSDVNHPAFADLKRLAMEAAERGEVDLAFLISECAMATVSTGMAEYLSSAMAEAHRTIVAAMQYGKVHEKRERPQ